MELNLVSASGTEVHATVDEACDEEWRIALAAFDAYFPTFRDVCVGSGSADRLAIITKMNGLLDALEKASKAVIATVVLRGAPGTDGTPYDAFRMRVVRAHYGDRA